MAAATTMQWQPGAELRAAAKGGHVSAPATPSTPSRSSRSSRPTPKMAWLGDMQVSEASPPSVSSQRSGSGVTSNTSSNTSCNSPAGQDSDALGWVSTNSKEEDAAEQPRFQVPTQLIAESVAQRYLFASSPLPRGGGLLKATFMRTYHGVFSCPRFSLYAEHEDGSLTFLAAAEKQLGHHSVRPYYILSACNKDFDRSSEYFLGRLQGNVLCTQYALVGPGRRPSKKHQAPSTDDVEPPREELAVIRFRKPGDAPRSMEVAIPLILSDGSRCEVRPNSPNGEGLQCAWEKKDGAEDPWQRFASPNPRWDEARQVYCMDFRGRVKKSSSKNFQLMQADQDFRLLQGSESELAMQFGKVSEDVFSMDVNAPLSPAQALAIALSMFDARIVERFRMYY